MIQRLRGLKFDLNDRARIFRRLNSDASRPSDPNRFNQDHDRSISTMHCDSQRLRIDLISALHVFSWFAYNKHAMPLLSAYVYILLCSACYDMIRYMLCYASWLTQYDSCPCIACMHSNASQHKANQTNEQPTILRRIVS